MRNEIVLTLMGVDKNFLTAMDWRTKVIVLNGLKWIFLILNGLKWWLIKVIGCKVYFCLYFMSSKFRITISIVETYNLNSYLKKN